MEKINATPNRRNTTQQDLKLAKQIQKVRKSAAFTQEELAEAINKSVTYVGYIESGLRIPNLKLLYKIARVLNVKVKDLFPF